MNDCWDPREEDSEITGTSLGMMVAVPRLNGGATAVYLN